MTDGGARGEGRRIEGALAELQGMIRERYPSATFVVALGEDQAGAYLTATVDIDDTDEVFGIVVERLLEFQIEEDLPVHVLPVRPVERVIAALRALQVEGSPVPLVV